MSYGSYLIIFCFSFLGKMEHGLVFEKLVGYETHLVYSEAKQGLKNIWNSWAEVGAHNLENIFDNFR